MATRPTRPDPRPRGTSSSGAEHRDEGSDPLRAQSRGFTEPAGRMCASDRRRRYRQSANQSTRPPAAHWPRMRRPGSCKPMPTNTSTASLTGIFLSFLWRSSGQIPPRTEWSVAHRVFCIGSEDDRDRRVAYLRRRGGRTGPRTGTCTRRPPPA